MMVIEGEGYLDERFEIPNGSPMQIFEALKRRYFSRFGVALKKIVYLTPQCRIQADEFTPDVLSTISCAYYSWTATARCELGLVAADFDLSKDSWAVSAAMLPEERTLMRRLLWTGDFREDGKMISDNDWLDEHGNTLFG